MNAALCTMSLVLFSILHFATSSATVNCKQNDKHAPCGCKTVISGVTLTHGGKMLDVEFQEAVCDGKVNKRRMKKGAFGGNYWCHQLRDEISITKDINGDPIDVKVKRKNGCELRCIKHCVT